MPTLPGRPCRGFRCPAIASTKEGYCPACQRSKHQRIDSNRDSSTERGYDSNWRKVRIQALYRDEYRCQECGWEPDILKLLRSAGAEASHPDILKELTARHQRGETHLHVDHRIPIEERPDLRLVLSNTQVLCSVCHNRKTLAESVSSR